MPKSVDPVDLFVGGSVRLVRQSRKMSQTALADAIGVSIPQLQKYENGLNRIGASRLSKIAKVLDVSVETFFEVRRERTPAFSSASLAVELLSSPHAVRMAKAFAKIDDDGLRRSLIVLSERIADREKR
ncbi:MAG: helix-turn-helix domain-containing protein [Proteobacteria bacterium]|nr:helix-turn-helix domain-containing protein [Pseudomonadota bacterium]